MPDMVKISRGNFEAIVTKKLNKEQVKAIICKHKWHKVSSHRHICIKCMAINFDIEKIELERKIRAAHREIWEAARKLVRYYEDKDSTGTRYKINALQKALTKERNLYDTLKHKRK
jgi:hypothetical protein